MFTLEELEAAWPDGSKHEAAVRDHVNAVHRARRAANLDRIRAVERRKRANNPHIYRAKCAAYRAGLNKATPPWVDRAELKRIYEFAVDMDREVDHIHPLNGKNFCGLHVPWNLQLLTTSENASKGNKLLPEFV